MQSTRLGRSIGILAVAAVALVPIAIAGAAFADDPGVQSTATVANGEELREQWAIGNNTLITLTADIDLGRDGDGNLICDGGASGEPIRNASTTGAITIDGQGLYGISQSCLSQRVLRDDAEGETVTLTGLTHFTGGFGDGNGGGLRNDGPVNVVSSDISGNIAAGQPCEVSTSDVQSQLVCITGDGGGVYAGSSGLAPLAEVAGYDITITDSVVTDNSADDDGGGLYTEGTISATRTQFENNTAHGEAIEGGRGGGAFARESLSSVDSTWTGNEALCGAFDLIPQPVAAADGECFATASGGGFYTEGSATVSGSAFNSNHAYDTGGGFFAADADVSNSTFTGNVAGGISSEADGMSASQVPSIAGAVGLVDDGSQECFCSGGGFAVGVRLAPTSASVPEGGASVVSSTFTSNWAVCIEDCMGSGGGFFSGGGANVSGSTFGDQSGEENGNSVGCFAGCGAAGGGAYIGGGGTVDTSTFAGNSGGCIIECGAEGGGVFAGNGSTMMGSVDGLADKLPDGAAAALADDGSLTVAQTTFAANSVSCAEACDGAGGGLFTSGNPTVDIVASTFNNNSAVWDGGAISINGGFGLNSVVCDAECGGTDATITNSTITGNTSGYPAAISSWGKGDTLTLVNDTIDSNTIEANTSTCAAATLCSTGDAAATECDCFAANVAAGDLTSFGTDVTHPLIDEGADPVATFSDVANCWVDDVNSEGFNFSDDDSCEFTDSTDNVADGNDPMLGALASNGGPTQTMLPLVGSPLIDAIQPVSECQVDVDQRGVSRPQIKGCDTGAVEVLGASLVVDKVVTGTAGNPVPANGYTFAVNCTDGTSTSVTVADATAGGSSETVNDIVPGAVCTVTEAPVVYTNANVVGQPVVSYDPAVGSPLGEGDTEVVTVTNNYEGINLLGIAVNLTPKFTG